jgi:Xaa-Pro aminopeptidase
MPHAMSEAAPSIDQARLRRYRLERVRAELRARDYAGAVFADAINVRYATGSRNMQLWTKRSPARYVFVATDGPVVMFEFAGCAHLLKGIEVIDEARTSTSWFYFTSGPRVSERAKKWAAELADLVTRHGGGNRRLAVDRINPEGAAALQGLGIEIKDGSEVAERARAIKSPEEIACLQESIAVCEFGLEHLRESLVPGITENQIWAKFWETVIANGAEYVETRLLSSGPRTNPWFQEAGERRIEAGDLVAFDTDLIGKHGYFADMSRTFLCGEGKPSGVQKELYGLAHEQVSHNMALLRPGVGFREFAEKSWPIPDRFVEHRYMSLIHGAGLCGEFPYISYPQDLVTKGYDGELAENMTVCVESFIGDERGGEGVKLEQLVLITARGAVPLTTFPFEKELLI